MPAGGKGYWYYEQKYGDNQELSNFIQKSSMSDLVDEVIRFRLQEGIRIGNMEDVELEIADYIREKSPINDLWKGRRANPNAQAVTRPITPLIERAQQWARVRLQGQVKLANIDQANARAEVCRKCPQNIRNWHSSCQTCNGELIQRGNLIRRQANYALDKKLGVCRLYGIFNPAAIFLDRDEHPERNVPNTPESCWIGKV